MSTFTRASVVVGVDVGGLKKGFHAVALCEGQFLEKLVTLNASEVVQWCRKLNASAIGVDAPCSWSRTGRARGCERALAAKGISTFATPSQKVGECHLFYRWMCNGAELFRLLTAHYRVFDGRPLPSRPVCFETFPHAIASALAKKILPARQKRRDRPGLLQEAGLCMPVPAGIDLIDAALCALMAQCLVCGDFRAYGDVEEGFIVVPDDHGPGRSRSLSISPSPLVG